MSRADRPIVGIIDDDWELWWQGLIGIDQKLRVGRKKVVPWGKTLSDLGGVEITSENACDYRADAFIIDVRNDDDLLKPGVSAIQKLTAAFPGALFVICTKHSPRDADVVDMVNANRNALVVNKNVPGPPLTSTPIYKHDPDRFRKPEDYLPVQLGMAVEPVAPLAGFLPDYIHAVPIQPAFGKNPNEELRSLVSAVTLNDPSLKQRIQDIGTRNVNSPERWSRLLFARSGRGISTPARISLLNESVGTA